MSFDYSSAGKRFASQNELLDCFADVLDLHIYYIYKYHYWVSPENSMQGMLGVVVTREEFEKGLLRASGAALLRCGAPLREAVCIPTGRYLEKAPDSRHDDTSVGGAGQAHSGLLPLFFRAGRADEVHLRPRRGYPLHPAAPAI